MDIRLCTGLTIPHKVEKIINSELKVTHVKKRIAVIDTETNIRNEVMSIGIVIAEDRNFEVIDSKYIIIKEAAKIGGMFSGVLYVDGLNTEESSRKKAMEEIRQFLGRYKVSSIFAYNASFDAGHLPELCDFDWRDIMKLAAYKQYNKAIPRNAECCSTGKLKKGYGVDDILRMLGEKNYSEIHNAMTDATDELRIMKYLGYPVGEYPGIK